MTWQRVGKLFTPSGDHPWMASHASTPFAEWLHDDLFRVYFTSRDKYNRSHIAWTDVDLITKQVISVADSPILTPGTLGTFDDSGTSLGWVTTINHKKSFFYLGWNLSVTVPWRNSIGMATLEHDGKLHRYSKAPLLDRHHVDPFSISYPCVLADEHGYQMWYGSNRNWGAKQEEMDHVIKYATSKDGINWKRTGIVAIDHKPGEYAVSRPSVIKDSSGYRMWFAYRGQAYKIGYAESKDGIHWERKDEAYGLSPSNDGWDSGMTCYGHVFYHKEKLYMIYNGNNYGKDGFGLALSIP